MQGFYFALLQYSHIQAFTARFASSTQNYTTHAAKQCTGLYRGFSCDLPHSTAANTRPTQAAIIPPAPRWSVCQRPDALQHIPDTSATPDAAQHSTDRLFNNVYKGAEVPACYRSMPARRGQLPPCMDRWQVLHPANLLRGQRLNLYRVSPTASRCFQRPAACNLAPSTRRAARNYWRLSPQLFSGFRPIANRGQ